MRTIPSRSQWSQNTCPNRRYDHPRPMRPPQVLTLSDYLLQMNPHPLACVSISQCARLARKLRIYYTLSNGADVILDTAQNNGMIFGLNCTQVGASQMLTVSKTCVYSPPRILLALLYKWPTF